jgi:hypothetical protein
MFALNIWFIRREFNPGSIWFLIYIVTLHTGICLAPCRLCLKLLLHYCDVRLVQ